MAQIWKIQYSVLNDAWCRIEYYETLKSEVPALTSIASHSYVSALKREGWVDIEHVLTSGVPLEMEVQNGS